LNALAQLGRRLLNSGYHFITPTPETHRRVLSRGGPARNLRDVFGWSKPFQPGLLEADLLRLLESAQAVAEDGPLLRSLVRFSSLGQMLVVHSAYPTVSADSVFFGPDTYRFAALLEARLEPGSTSPSSPAGLGRVGSSGSLGRVADVGCGSGAGGLLLAARAASVQLLDVNEAALAMARVNAELNGLAVRAAKSDVLAGAEGPLDLVIANPPYLVDEQRRTYRDGGAALGTALSARIVREALERLEPGGRLLLYTATPVVDGAHLLWPQLEPLLGHAQFDYRELDPDVFGEELDRPAYAQAERIALVALDAVKIG